MILHVTGFTLILAVVVSFWWLASVGLAHKMEE